MGSVQRINVCSGRGAAGKTLVMGNSRRGSADERRQVTQVIKTSNEGGADTDVIQKFQHKTLHTRDKPSKNQINEM
ncbi:hypothetical protein E2C01_039438 [Portunus trituberculatus]|uniref:Uncharacterized protein n=1 Tax=Portunus trituberculatus TaxID=210409 RepID=A0A5B7FGU8_PORTR|nr:hypothetical protein [Portunus trituberculatus]